MQPQAAIDAILDAFAQVSAVPRCSGHEEGISQMLQGWAAERSFSSRTDAVGNLLISVPASPGFEAAETIVLQGHLDMVCEKTPESTHNFSTDGIRLVRDGDWLSADQTTLGADNGIAIAMSMVLATTTEAPHPPLELLFTVDEETGLTGANNIEAGFLTGSLLLNIDSEDEGVFTVGCAGGREIRCYLPLSFEEDVEGQAWLLTAGGMKGGHSGVDIHNPRGNAVRVLTRALLDLCAIDGVHLADLSGGTAHNAIPRDGRALLLVQPEALAGVQARVDALQATLQAEFVATDPGLFLKLSPGDQPSKVIAQGSVTHALDFLFAMPHGVAAMSTDIEGLVETSNNEAMVAIEGDELVVLSSQRSSVMSRLAAHTDRIASLTRLAGGRSVVSGGYPAWQPDMDSPLLKRCVRIYDDLFERHPVVEIIHAGLECGVIGSKYPELDMISLGPTIVDPHCPDERINVPSIGAVWTLLVALMRSFEPRT